MKLQKGILFKIIRVLEAIDAYISEGYKIAIDDAGSDYSGLKTISETKPNYIKIDMDIIRDVDKDHFK